jgi:hypothetical protein
MWAYTPTTCSAIQAGTQAPVRCNYNGSCEQFTGISATLPAGATSMTNWEAPVTVGSMTKYLICLSNYSSASTSVPLSFGGTAVVSCTPLGVEMIELTGKNEPGYNTLEWAISAEFNADKYIIERSEDGNSFEPIGIIEAKGLSMETETYHFEDLEPLTGIGMYRITMVRENGTSVNSNTLSLDRQFMDELEIVKTYPNPVNDELNIVLSSKTDGFYTISLSTVSGQTIYETNQSVKKGLTHTSIDAEQLHSGLYLLNIISNGKKLATQKVVIE